MAAAPPRRAERIAVVLHDLPLGGTERIVLRLAGRWAALGRKVTLLVGSAQGPLRPLVPAAVELVELSPPVPRGFGSRVRLRRALGRCLAGREFDLLFIPGNFHWSQARAAPAGTRVVAQLSAPLRRRDRRGLKARWFAKRARHQLARADALVSLSDAMTAEADAIFGAGRTRRIALPALEDDTPPPAGPATGETILCLGRLVPEKGFVTAVEAFAMLGRPETRLVICGEGPERARIEAAARRLGVASQVRLEGFVADVRPHLDAARLLLLTSDFEGYGAVVIEALAAGRPVVATDCSPSVAELVRPSGGAVAAVGDAAGLARGMAEVLDAPPPDPARLAALVGGYRLGPAADAYLALFDAVMAC